jgi:hypothetical protein
VVNFRKLNKVTIKINFPFPSIKDEFGKFKNMKYLSKLDMKNGYYQLMVAENDVKKTAFTTPIGQFEFLRLFLDFFNTPKAFQRAIMTILSDLSNVKVYLVDIIFTSRSINEHVKDLENVFEIILEIYRD